MPGRSAGFGEAWRRVAEAARAAARPLKRAIPPRLRRGLRGWLHALGGPAPPRVVHLPRGAGARRIVIDAEPLRHPRAGIGTYTYEITRALLRSDRRSDYYLMNLAGDRGPVALPRGIDP